jgi:hypothetical protein
MEISWLRRVTRTLHRRHSNHSEWLALVLIAIGILIRLGLLLLDWPRTDSDEGTMGLMALHVVTRGEHPLFFYGQSYMGTLQAYIGASFFFLFGASVFTLRLGLVLLFALFLATMYALLCLLYERGFALFALFLLSLGTPELLKPQLLALGGYPETLLFGALSLLLATRLALSVRLERAGRSRWLRMAAYAGFGATLGLGWWSDQLILPFIVAAALLVVTCCPRDLRWANLAAGGAGLVIGALPQLVYTLRHPAEAGPTAVAAFQPQGVSTLVDLPVRLGAQLPGAFLISLPDITGPGWLCAGAVEPTGLPATWSDSGALACAGMRLGWSLGLLTLGVFAAVSAFGAWRASVRAIEDTGWSPTEHRMTVVHFARLMLLLGGGLTLAIYVISPAAIPPGHTRYLIGMNIALPALICPLWSAGRAAYRDTVVPRRLWRLRAAGYWGCLGLVMLALMGGVVSTYTLAPATHTQYEADQTLIRDLEQLGVRHMYTDYWTCYKVAFLTREQVTCDVLGDMLEQGNNRYPPYVATVQADPSATYVFLADSSQAAAFLRQIGTPEARFIRLYMDGYVLFLPSDGDGNAIAETMSWSPLSPGCAGVWMGADGGHCDD